MDEIMLGCTYRQFASPYTHTHTNTYIYIYMYIYVYQKIYIDESMLACTYRHTRVNSTNLHAEHCRPQRNPPIHTRTHTPIESQARLDQSGPR